MDAKKYYCSGDSDYIIARRREFHRHPELGFDMDNTIAIIKRELDGMGIPYTEKYGISSVVATINPDCAGPCLAIRADMDALAMDETTGDEFASEIPGRMHGCGHDAHAATLLGTARALKRAEKDLTCRVKLLFQPNEESFVKGGGARPMVEDGVLDDVDAIIGLHVDNAVESGTIGIRPGVTHAAAAMLKIEFHGKSTHAARPHTGCDALAMAVKTYNDIQIMLTRQIDPFDNYVLSICQLNAGSAYNVVPDSATMGISLRTHRVEVNNFIEEKIQMIARHAAEEMGGTVDYTGGLMLYPTYNDPDLTVMVANSAKKILGEDMVKEAAPRMGSEDFSFYQRVRPGVFFRLGTRNAEKGCTTMSHQSNFRIDEDALIGGSQICVQFVLDYMEAHKRDGAKD